MITALLNYGGFIVGVVSLVIGVLSHANVQKAINRNPKSIMARLQRLVFGGPRRGEDLPSSVTIAEIIYDQRYRSELLALLPRVGPDFTFEMFKARFAQSHDIKFAFSDVTRAKLVAGRILFDHFVASVVCEFGAHFILLRDDFDFRALSLPVREGLFLLVSKAGREITVEDIEQLDVEVDANEYWRNACDWYYAASLLPYRSMTNSGAFEMHTNEDFRMYHSVARSMYEGFSVYAAVARSGDKLSKEASELVSTTLHKATKSMRALDRMIAELAEQSDELPAAMKGRFFVELEVLISLIHKAIVGSLDIGRRAVASSTAISVVNTLWSGAFSYGAMRQAREPDVVQLLSKLESQRRSTSRARIVSEPTDDSQTR